MKKKANKALKLFKNLQVRIPTAPPSFKMKDKKKYNRKQAKLELKKSES